jgi:cytochrome d ubiquinol oxidase subunit I
MIAIEFGWIATEIGRQPWIVQGLLKTKDAASSVVPAGQIVATLALFVVVYALLFVVWFRKMRKAVVTGPQETIETGYSDTPAAAGAVAGAAGDLAAVPEEVKQ